MRIAVTSLCLLAVSVFMFSCKKSVESTDWREKLKNTVWQGEYALTGGEFRDNQPFSIVLSEDGTLKWSDLISTRPGGTWVTSDDKITVTLPNGTMFSATVSDEDWINFDMSPGIGFQFINVSRSAVPKVSDFVGTSWSGDLRGYNIVIKFTDAAKLDYTFNNVTIKQLSYTIEGGGIRFKFPSASAFFYFNFEPGSKLNGSQYDSEAPGLGNPWAVWRAVKLKL